MSLLFILKYATCATKYVDTIKSFKAVLITMRATGSIFVQSLTAKFIVVP